MLGPQQQWCPRCDRYVETDQEQTKVGRRGNLVKIVTTCQRCRTTLSSKTTTARVLEEMQPDTATEQSPTES